MIPLAHVAAATESTMWQVLAVIVILAVTLIWLVLKILHVFDKKSTGKDSCHDTAGFIGGCEGCPLNDGCARQQKK